MAMVAWDHYIIPCACGEPADRIYGGAGSNVIDDTLPGGPRWMHNLGDVPIWVEKKSDLRQLMQARGLVPAERNVYNRNDKSPWASRTRLRPGEHDPFVHRVG